MSVLKAVNLINDCHFDKDLFLKLFLYGKQFHDFFVIIVSYQVTRWAHQANFHPVCRYFISGSVSWMKLASKLGPTCEKYKFNLPNIQRSISYFPLSSENIYKSKHRWKYTRPFRDWGIKRKKVYFAFNVIAVRF